MATNNQLFTSYDFSKLFLYDNKFVSRSFTNSGGAPVTITRGMLMGTILASGKVLQSVSTAVDGSEFPIGVLANDYTVAAGATVTVQICVWGKVAKSGITLGGADTWTTAIRTVSTGGATVEDALRAKSGIWLANSEDQTFLDNS